MDRLPGSPSKGFGRETRQKAASFKDDEVSDTANNDLMPHLQSQQARSDASWAYDSADTHHPSAAIPVDPALTCFDHRAQHESDLAPRPLAYQEADDETSTFGSQPSSYLQADDRNASFGNQHRSAQHVEDSDLSFTNPANASHASAEDTAPYRPHSAPSALATGPLQPPLVFLPPYTPNTYQGGHTAATTSLTPKQQPSALGATNIFQWCQRMGYISPDTALPARPSGGKPYTLDTFLALTPVRQLSRGGKTGVEWHPGTKPYPNWYALFCQVVGVLPPSPCQRCAEGKGRWDECIVAPTAETAFRMRGACASCTFQEQGSKCSFYNIAEPGHMGRRPRGRAQEALAEQTVSTNNAVVSRPAPSAVYLAPAALPTYRPLLPAPSYAAATTASPPSQGAPSLSLQVPSTRQAVDGQQSTSNSDGGRRSVVDDMNELFNELAKNERTMQKEVARHDKEVAKIMARRADIESRLLAAGEQLDEPDLARTRT